MTDDHLRREVEEVIESLKQNHSYYTDTIVKKLTRALNEELGPEDPEDWQ